MGARSSFCFGAAHEPGSNITYILKPLKKITCQRVFNYDRKKVQYVEHEDTFKNN